jgi:dimethylsulfone monooxygenase
MVAVRPTFHHPARLAKQAANIDRISNGRLSLNVVSSWWQDEARRYGSTFDEHDNRYARTAEWLEIVSRAWSEPRVTFHGQYYQVADLVVQPPPVRSLTRPRPVLYAGGESEAAKSLISTRCDAYVMHGDPPERLAPKIADLCERRARAGRPPMQYGVAAYSIVRDTEREVQQELARITAVTPGSPGYGNFQDWLSNTKLEQQLTVQDYSVSNRGLRTGLVGTPEQVAERVEALSRVGVDLLLLQCSPQLEEMERFAAQVMPLVGGSRRAAA